MRCYGESEAHLHAARIPLHGRIEKALDLGEGDYFVELPSYFGPSHPKDRTAEVYVFASGQLRMETCAHFEQGRDATLQNDSTRRWLRDSRKDLQQSGLASAIPADDPYDLAAENVE